MIRKKKPLEKKSNFLKAPKNERERKKFMKEFLSMLHCNDVLKRCYTPNLGEVKEEFIYKMRKWIAVRWYGWGIRPRFEMSEGCDKRCCNLDHLVRL